MTDIRHGYKILTHDWCPPVQGGGPLCAGTLPVTLPPVPLDLSERECGTGGGYHYSAELHQAARIAGFWRTGHPARCLVVTAAEDAIERGDKRRSSSLTLDRLCTEAEIQAAMHALVTPWAGAQTEALVAEQWAWYVALGRPEHDADRVDAELRRALDARALTWTPKRYRSAREAWEVREVRAAWEAWTARAAWVVRAAWEAWTAREAREAREAWTAWTARAAWAAWAAREAGNSLAIESAVRCGWLTGYRADQYTIGIRDAYHHGLALALPTGKNELGWAMEEPR